MKRARVTVPLCLSSTDWCVHRGKMEAGGRDVSEELGLFVCNEPHGGAYQVMRKDGRVDTRVCRSRRMTVIEVASVGGEPQPGDTCYDEGAADA